MKPRWESNPKGRKAKITKPTSGSIVDRAEQWRSTSGWAGNGRAPKRFLGNFEGILQTDGYAAYDHVGGPKMVRAACWGA